AGGRTATVQVTVSNTALQTVEDFEGTTTIFRGGGSNMDYSLNHSADTVRYGKGSAKVDYTLTESSAYTAEWWADTSTSIGNALYTSLNLWVYGDGSGNVLSLLYSDGTTDRLSADVTTLDFTGWKQVSVSISGSAFTLQG